ncbi:MAG TPA: sulfotransferase [Rhizomicrobium sp.]|jgi:tetratricopeptide (TPR) repeat protein|nr:sulfotransferase [Rhizomicrobium sp.]
MKSEPFRTPSPTEVRTVTAISAAVAASDLSRAYELANWAIGQGMSNRITHNARGLALQSAGQHWKAIEEFRRALAYSPGDPLILNAIGLSEMALLRFDKAVEAFDDALTSDPNSALTHYRRGLALARSGDHEAAKLSYERAIDLAPDHAESLAGLASIYARKRNEKVARDYASRALAAESENATAQLALVILDMNAGRYADAERQLRTLLPALSFDSDLRAGMRAMLGDALDGQGRHSEAFEVYAQNNDEIRAKYGAQFRTDRGAEAIRHITDYFRDHSAKEWTTACVPPPDRNGPREHIFLLGFMRSGTTLLEQVLASNSDVVALEEKALLRDAERQYMSSNEELDALARIQGDELEAARQSYWAKAHEYGGGDLAGKIFVDKQPLNTPLLPVIAKLFPQAKVLFALRDPRDVVFSCFRRNFRIHAAAFEFLTLEDTANFYAGVMELAEIYRNKLPLRIFDHRYEDMVRDFEGRVRAVCDFIGLEWSESMRDFDRNAPKVDLRSPSARQVQRPLYGEGIGQWRNYAEQMKSTLPILAPWVRRFGYSEE